MSDVVLYGADWCEYTRNVRMLLDRSGHEYREVEVPMEREQRDELERATGQRGCPALVVDGTVYLDVPEMMRALRETKLARDAPRSR